MNSSVRLRVLIRSTLLLGFVGLCACVRIVPLDRAKEKVLKQDLFTLRQAIDQYTLDKQKEPASLEDLVKAGYLKWIPIDPLTGRRDWEIHREPEMQDPPAPGQLPGIVEMHSAARLMALDGSPYNYW
jgi:general secretion pathway protein G